MGILLRSGDILIRFQCFNGKGLSMKRTVVSSFVFLAVFSLAWVAGASNDPRDLPADVPTSLELETQYKWTALHWAVRRGQVENVRNLLGREDIEARDFQGRTPLHIAVLSGHDAIVSLLLRNGADVNARDQWGITPLRRAELLTEYRRWDRQEIKRMLRENGGETRQIVPGYERFEPVE